MQQLDGQPMGASRLLQPESVQVVAGGGLVLEGVGVCEAGYENWASVVDGPGSLEVDTPGACLPVADPAIMRSAYCGEASLPEFGRCGI